MNEELSKRVKGVEEEMLKTMMTVDINDLRETNDKKKRVI